MKKCQIRVYSNLNNIEENNEFLAIKSDKLIKYIDLENNKMTIDIENDAIIRENSDYLFNLDFNNNKIIITMKKLNKTLEKPIKTLAISKNTNSYLIRYKLMDDDVINEYYVKF